MCFHRLRESLLLLTKRFLADFWFLRGLCRGRLLNSRPSPTDRLSFRLDGDGVSEHELADGRRDGAKCSTAEESEALQDGTVPFVDGSWSL